jgi:superfamily I DNA and RNA helicase
LSSEELKNPNVNQFLKSIDDKQADLEASLKARLLENRQLRRRSDLTFDLHVISLISFGGISNVDDLPFVCAPQQLAAVLNRFPAITDQEYLNLNATIQRTTSLKAATKRDYVQRQSSRGAVLKKIDAEIANLDKWQKQASIEMPEGPQRIRGLAGSGKTIVLAQKAAYLHSIHPEWRLCVTFYTQSLYQQFRSLIRRFYMQFAQDEPDWAHLQVMHCWGGAHKEGLYATIAAAFDFDSLDFRTAQSKFGQRAFDGICEELLASIKLKYDGQEPPSLFDVIIIDEAQDLPPSFFQLAYAVTAKPKRIAFAYDELQTLSDISMPSVAKLFGTRADGTPVVTLQNLPDEPQQDIILPRCYRNTPWALTTAHGLGFGIYRKTNQPTALPFVQMFDEPELWRDIGYEVREGSLAFGKNVALARSEKATPGYFKELIEPADALITTKFETQDEEFSWIADSIGRNINNDEILPEDIIVIWCDVMTIRSAGAKIGRELNRRDIKFHIAGITTTADKFFVPDSVALTHIYRAKGNEAPMVYIAGADTCYSGFELQRKRNTLFTAITRSKAWVRLTGIGPAMERLKSEVEEVVQREYQLQFLYPNLPQIEKIRTINRDMTESQRKSLQERVKGASELLAEVAEGRIEIDALPEELRDIFEAGLAKRNTSRRAKSKKV